MRFLALRGADSSRCGDVGEPGDGHDVVLAEEDAGTVAANSVANRVVDVNFSSCCAVAEIVKVCVDHFEILLIAADERTQTNIGRSEIDDDDLADQGQEKRRQLPRMAFCGEPLGSKKNSVTALDQLTSWRAPKSS